ncbi:hypothetical protein EON66_00155 [archaeon]|nr:MAG: hypothetical protein EON66_00155 [archaeon]
MQMSARTSSDKLEGTEYDLRSWTILQMVEFLKERGVINSAHDLRRSLEKPRWQLLNLVRNVIHESRTKDMQHYADVRINAAERAAKKATQANEIQAQQRKALSKTEVSRMTEMEVRRIYFISSLLTREVSVFGHA